MVEVIDIKTGHKMIMMIMCGIKYQNDSYLIYCISREQGEANVFVSKLIKGGFGHIINNNFSNGEKEVLDKVVNRLLNKEDISILEAGGFSILKNIKMDDYLEFDIDACYVATVDKKLIKDCLIYYDLVNEDMINRPVVEVVDDSRKFNEGFVSSIVLIVFGVLILLVAGIAIFNFIF